MQVNVIKEFPQNTQAQGFIDTRVIFSWRIIYKDVKMRT